MMALYAASSGLAYRSLQKLQLVAAAAAAAASVPHYTDSQQS
jgi:hypothetical protein